MPGQNSQKKEAPLPLLTKLMIAIAAAFVLQRAGAQCFGAGVLEAWFGLSFDGLMHGLFWTPLTYSFLHEGLGHLLVNLCVLFFAWRAVEPVLGARRCLGLYFWSVFGGAALWLLATGTGRPHTELIGASAGAFGVFAAFCFLNWERPVTFLIFFLVPLRVKPKWLFAFFAGAEACSMLLYELPARLGVHGALHAPIAFSAHVGGMFAAWLCVRAFTARSGRSREPLIRPPAWLRKKRGTARSDLPYTVNYGARGQPSADELNRILDKLAAQGFGALTPEERDALDGARARLRKR